MTKRDEYLLTPVMLKVEENPKKKGSMSYDRFEGYFAARAKHGNEFTIKDAYKEGVRGDDIRHDHAHGFIALGDDEIAELEAAKPVEMVAADLEVPAPEPVVETKSKKSK